MKTQRLLAIASFTLLMFAATGCKPDWPKCDKDDHCKEKDGQVLDYVCVNGTCRECGADGDCQEGFICRDFSCVPKPECASNSDCTDPERSMCRNEKCVPECTTDGECSTGMKCQQNRCVPDVECTSNADCSEGQECTPEGKCVTAVARCTLEPVYFDFNQFSLTSDARGTLESNAQCLTQRQGSVTVAGHADERGTEEYNLALGEKRANSARKYLQTLGVDSSRLRTTSYGEERPVCSEASEDCWQRNRRAEFELASPGM